MTATPTMTPKTTVTGVMLACIGAVALIVILQFVQLPGTGGWRSTAATPVEMSVPVQARATNAGATVAEAGGVSAMRARN